MDDTSSAIITKLTKNDVVLGRGAPIDTLPGNRQFREIINSYWKIYDGGRRKKRREVAGTVLHKITKLDPPGRFVQALTDEDEGEYVEVAMKRALEKITQAFRDERKRRTASQTTSSDAVAAPKTRRRTRRKTSFSAAETAGSISTIAPFNEGDSYIGQHYQWFPPPLSAAANFDLHHRRNEEYRRFVNNFARQADTDSASYYGRQHSAASMSNSARNKHHTAYLQHKSLRHPGRRERRRRRNENTSWRSPSLFSFSSMMASTEVSSHLLTEAEDPEDALPDAPFHDNISSRRKRSPCMLTTLDQHQNTDSQFADADETDFNTSLTTFVLCCQRLGFLK